MKTKAAGALGQEQPARNQTYRISIPLNPQPCNPVHLAYSPDLRAIMFYMDGREIYYIEFDQIRTAGDALDWLRQLCQKTWTTKQLLAQFCTMVLCHQDGMRQTGGRI